VSCFAAVGMLWTGEQPEFKAIEENMASYFNTLQGFLLVSHGSTVGAGPTLTSAVHASVKQVVDSSFRLMKETISLYGMVITNLCYAMIISDMLISYNNTFFSVILDCRFLNLKARCERYR